MQFSPPSEETQEEVINRLENRIERLEQEIGFLKEKGLSSDEQDIVLDRRQKVRKPRKNLLPVVYILFSIVLLWLSYLTYQLSQPQTAEPSHTRDSNHLENSKEPLIIQTNNSYPQDSIEKISDGEILEPVQNKKKKGTFSLPPRVPDLK